VRGEQQSSRRDLLQEGLAAVLVLIAVACSPARRKKSRSQSSVPAPSVTNPFDTRIDVGTVTALRASIAQAGAPRYLPDARGYVSAFPSDLANSARGVYPAELMPVLAAGVVVLHQRCPHLGCRVPFCETSQWFECPCHAAKFDRVGEYRSGPSPSGMNLIGASIENGRLIVDTGTTFPGRAVGTNTTHQRPEGPACVS
jgi:cytochrome b6-f complex iron-sulfur subunit